ncbi:M23 family metallopeptidase [Tissierella carlieri]|uniref:M23 family metallopeptidase n=1 Tax=Tissierella carlieri TaxID=689904 RepID=UPI001C10B470|nr:M23 family metallopeptidase [Tissierella carlieri]MBU5310727.1 M23 family metallopeptidase [Tissierella carlieri]MDU5079790.1 M23 family metallopeptidase [Bacillota bacterium]
MKNKLIKLIEKEGFILFLFVCVCVVAGGTLFISMRNMNISKNASHKIGNDDLIILDEELTKEPNIYDENLHMTNVTDADAIDAEIIAASAADNEEDTVEANSDEEGIAEINLDEEDIAETNTENLEFEEEDEQEEYKEDSDLVQEVKTIVLPIDGSIITEYTSNSLIYSETLDSWVGHGAVDIEASENTIVKAAADGVVKEVYEDELWGIVIVIDHGNDLQTKYSGLGTKEMVKVGLNVKKGDHISKVGNTAKIEMLMKPHLHFEVIKNGKLVDPRSINN